MSKRKDRNTKGKIITAAWKLFYELGYDETTVDEIIEESGTSKGSFYHYFDGKDALLSSLSELFDAKYSELSETMDRSANAFDLLMFLNKELFSMVESTVSLELLARLYSSQLVTKGERHLLDQDRVYYKLLRQIVVLGQQRGELRDGVPANEIVKTYALCERALLYDWCICNGQYSLREYSQKMMPKFMLDYKL